MKKLTTLSFALCLVCQLMAQVDTVHSGLISLDSAKLSIVNVFPDSFPNVSVVFKAQDKFGEPLWGMGMDKLSITEDGANCELISLEQVSKNKPINIALVIDHSGSMKMDLAQLYYPNGTPKFKYNLYTGIQLPKGYVSPMTSAKKAVTSFVSGLDTSKDKVSIIGFSTRVDKHLPLTNNVDSINALVKSIEADSSTAFYDALMAGIESLQGADGINLVLALTDGNDNASIATVEQVMAKANEEEIPLYLVGLGEANTDTLKLLADNTGGIFEFTKSSESLNEVYEKIRKQIQAFYSLLYASTNYEATDCTRTVLLSFEPSPGNKITAEDKANFPTELVAYIAEKERTKQMITYGGIAAGAVGLGVLIFLVARKRRKDEEENDNNIT